jgi:chitodextrinase
MTVDGYDALITQSSASLSADGLTFRVRFASAAALAGLDLRCAAADSVWTSKYEDPGCNYFDCAVTKIELDGVHKNAWFDRFAPVPSAPTNVSVTGKTSSSLVLAWQEDDKSVTGFEVLRDGQVVGTTDKTSFTVPGLSCGQSYTLSVRADTRYAHSADAPVSGTTAVCALKAPGHVTVSTGKSSARVTWGATTGATSYVVTVGSHSAKATGHSVTVRGLRCGTTYAVTVRAIGPDGKSSAAHAVAHTKHC